MKIIFPHPRFRSLIRIKRILNNGGLQVVLLLLLNYIVFQCCHVLGDDNQALIWDIHSMPRPVDDPILAYQAEGEV